MRVSEQPLISAAAIAARVEELGRKMTADYENKCPLLLAVLKGASLFVADLARALPLELELDFVQARSYAGTRSTGSVSLSRAEDLEVAGRHVVVVEDIVDTGRTAAALLERIRQLSPASLALCALLDKPSRRVVDVHPDYTGFAIEDHFVVGYGLDYDGLHRNLPAVHVMEE
jgi:hypoxanthine phosphoribosyltransferase